MTNPPCTVTEPELAGMRVLVIEDDYFIASEICTALRKGGAEIVGPAADVDNGLALIRTERIDCAVLDINLHGEIAFRLADELQSRGTRAIFATGYDTSVIPAALAGNVHLKKPIELTSLLRAVRDSRRLERH
jgi:DNA-binding response OmpR family regulator